MRALSKIAIKEIDEAVELACADATSYSEVARLALQALIPLGDRHGFLAREGGTEDSELQAAYEKEQRETAEMVAANDLSWDNVVKCTVFLADIAEWPAFNEVYKTYFTGN